MKLIRVSSILLLFLQLNIQAQELKHFHITADSSINGPQNIHLIEIELNKLGNNLEIDMAWSDSALYTTSHFARENNALLAINAGFFSIKDGGSVTYLEDEGKQVSHRSWKGDKKPDQKTNFNAAFVLKKSGELKIEWMKSSAEYLESEEEQWVFTAGPMLLQNGEKSDLLDGSFKTKKHPRTALCLKQKSLLLITIDGRHFEAKGATLPELQNFLKSQGCIDAMNLDGGGSTTMWMNNKVVTCPSDNQAFDNMGERKVANVLLIRKKE